MASFSNFPPSTAPASSSSSYVCAGNGIGANPMNFTENQQGNVVLEKLRQQRENGRFCDVVLVVQDKHFPAHRNILAACSPYFDSILKMHKVVKELVTVTCQSADVFELLLNYMYSGNVVIDRHNVAELLKLANNFLVSKLKNYCAEYLDRYLDAGNCLCVKELAEKYNMPGLAKNAAHFAETHINAVLCDCADILEYSINRAEAFLADKNYSNATLDAQLRYIIRYVEHQFPEREAYFTQLLSIIQTSFRKRPDAGQFLAEFAERAPYFQRSPSSLFALLQSARENGVIFDCRCEKLYRSVLNYANCGQGLAAIDNYFNTAPDGIRQENVISDIVVQPQQQQLHQQRLILISEAKPHVLMNDSTASCCSTESISTYFQDGINEVAMQAQTFTVKQEPPTTPPPSTGVEFGHLICEDHHANVVAPETYLQNPRMEPADCRPIRIRLKLGDRVTNRTLSESERRIQTENEQGFSFTTEDIGTPLLNCGESVAKTRRRRQPRLRHSLSQIETVLSSNCDPSDGVTTSSNLSATDPVEMYLEPALGCAVSPSPLDCYNESSSYEEPLSLSSSDESSTRDYVGNAKAEILFKCPNCVYTSSNQSRIQSHIEKAHSKNRSYLCTVCSYECKWNREYYMHMKDHFQGPPFHCDTCDYVAERIQMLLTHRMKHTDERPFQCKQCDYKCRTKTNLAAHMRSHTGEKPFTCPSCFRGFAIKSTLDQHLATHSDARPFVCDQCSFSTKYQSHLISHKRIHTGDVFHCQYPDCAYTSPKKSQLAAHMRTHMAVRAHVCKQCGRSFIEKSHLVRHERIHLQVKPFKCDQCNYASSRRDKLKEHVQKHHISSGSRGVDYQNVIALKNQLRATKRGGRSRLLSALGFAAGRNRPSAGIGRYSASLAIGRPHSSMGFRPITPHNGNGTQMGNMAVGGTVPTGTPVMDISAFLASPTCGNDSLMPIGAGGHVYQPSPFEGGAALNNGDVLLSTQTGALSADSPHSTTNSLLSDPFPSAATPVSDPLQRPVSLPPLGAGNWPPVSDYNYLNSFMAMF